MKGFIIFENKSGKLLYSKNYNILPYTSSQVVLSEQSSQVMDTTSQKSGSIAGASSLHRSSKSSRKGQKEEGSALKRTQTLQKNAEKILDPKEMGNEKKFSKESVDYYNNQIDNQDPKDLAYKIFAIMQVANDIAEEYREMYPNHSSNDPSIKIAFRSSLQSFKSDSVDFELTHSPHYPITIGLFYDS